MMRTPNQDKKPSGSKMGVLLQRSFSTVVLLGLLAGALWWDRELGYYGLVCIFCILASWEWRHMLLRSRKASQPNLSFLFGAAYFDSLVESDTHRLFKEYVHAMLKGIDSALCVCHVVGTNRNRVKLFVVDELFVAGVCTDVFETVSFEERIGFAGNKVSARNDFDIVHFKI